MLYVNVVVELNTRSVVENKLDTLIDLLNSAGSDISRAIRKQYTVRFYYELKKLNQYNVVEIFFEKNKKKNLMIRFSMEPREGEDSLLLDKSAQQLIKYIIYAKDYNCKSDKNGTEINVFSAKTIFE